MKQLDEFEEMVGKTVTGVEMINDGDNNSCIVAFDNEEFIIISSTNYGSWSELCTDDYSIRQHGVQMVSLGLLDSDEYDEYVERERQMSKDAVELRERRTYERLKQKFEKGGNHESEWGPTQGERQN